MPVGRTLISQFDSAIRSPRFLLLAKYVALFGALLIPHILDNDYWIVDIEFWVTVGFAVLAGAVVAFTVDLVPALEKFFLAFWIYWFLDVYVFDAWAIALLCGVCALVLLAHASTRNVMQTLTFFFASGFLATSLLKFPPALLVTNGYVDGASPLSSRGDLPPIVHLILDEHISPAWIPNSKSVPRDARKLVDGLVSRGFAVFPNTQSISSKTQISLSQMIRLAPATAEMKENVAKGTTRDFSFVSLSNPYADRLRAAGYTIEFFQSSYIQFCDTARVNCRTYSRDGNGHQMARFGGRIRSRLAAALHEFHFDYFSPDSVRSVGAYRAIVEGMRYLGAPVPMRRLFFTSPAAVLGVFDELDRVLSTPRRGTVYFAHLLMPHFPYIVDQKCRLAPPEQWASPLWTVEKGTAKVGDVRIRYWQQVACVQRRVKGLVDRVTASAQGKDAIFIIHGDHGARLGARVSDSKLKSKEQVGDFLQPLYAIKAPGIASGVHPEKNSLQSLFRDHINHILR